LTWKRSQVRFLYRPPRKRSHSQQNFLLCIKVMYGSYVHPSMRQPTKYEPKVVTPLRARRLMHFQRPACVSPPLQISRVYSFTPDVFTHGFEPRGPASDFSGWHCVREVTRNLIVSYRPVITSARWATGDVFSPPLASVRSANP
jgi:hypothetical protein